MFDGIVAREMMKKHFNCGSCSYRDTYFKDKSEVNMFDGVIDYKMIPFYYCKKHKTETKLEHFCDGWKEDERN